MLLVGEIEYGVYKNFVLSSQFFYKLKPILRCSFKNRNIYSHISDVPRLLLKFLS